MTYTIGDWQDFVDWLYTERNQQYHTWKRHAAAKRWGHDHAYTFHREIYPQYIAEYEAIAVEPKVWPVAAQAIIDPATGEEIVSAGQEIDDEVAERLRACGLESELIAA